MENKSKIKIKMRKENRKILSPLLSFLTVMVMMVMMVVVLVVIMYIGEEQNLY